MLHLYIDPNRGTLQTFKYPTIESARIGAEAKARTIGNCRIDDRTGI
jgi:hypothetical protein